MIHQHRYVSLEVLKLLIKKGCSLCKPIKSLINSRTPVYYTKSPNQKGFEDCYTYYYPTQDQVIDWLEQEYKIFVYSFPLFDFTKYDSKFIGKYGTAVLTGDRRGYGAERNYKSKEDAINAALLKVLKDLI